MNRIQAEPVPDRMPAEVSPVVARRRRPQALAALALLWAALFVLQGAAVQRFYTSLVPGGNDFYPRWYGARVLLTDNRNPYDREVTREIEAVLDPLQQRTNSFNFAFPLPVVFALWPLAYLPYSWAQAFWMVLGIWSALALVIILVRLYHWRLTRVRGALLGLLVLTAYPVVRTLFLGQFTLLVTLFLALALLLLQRRQDFGAGLCLALTVIKPQMVIFVAPWLLLWAWRQRRPRLMIGLIAGGLALLIGSMALLPTWPLDFLRGLGEYAAVAGGRNALGVLLGRLWPGYPPLLAAASAGLLLVAMLFSCFRAWRQRSAIGDHAFEQALGWALVVTLLVPFQTGTTNQVLLLLPFFAWGAVAVRRRGWPATLLIAFVMTAALWLLFGRTLRGAAESELMFLPLPLLTLGGLFWKSIRRSGKSLATR